MTSAEMEADFAKLLEHKQQRLAAEEILGEAKDPAKIKQIREEVLCPAPQYSNFDLEALTGQLIQSTASSSYSTFMGQHMHGCDALQAQLCSVEQYHQQNHHT